MLRLVLIATALAFNARSNGVGQALSSSGSTNSKKSQWQSTDSHPAARSGKFLGAQRANTPGRRTETPAGSSSDELADENPRDTKWRGTDSHPASRKGGFFLGAQRNKAQGSNAPSAVADDPEPSKWKGTDSFPAGRKGRFSGSHRDAKASTAPELTKKQSNRHIIQNTGKRPSQEDIKRQRKTDPTLSTRKLEIPPRRPGSYEEPGVKKGRNEELGQVIERCESFFSKSSPSYSAYGLDFKKYEGQLMNLIDSGETRLGNILTEVARMNNKADKFRNLQCEKALDYTSLIQAYFTSAEVQGDKLVLRQGMDFVSEDKLMATLRSAPRIRRITLIDDRPRQSQTIKDVILG